MILPFIFKFRVILIEGYECLSERILKIKKELKKKEESGSISEFLSRFRFDIFFSFSNEKKRLHLRRLFRFLTMNDNKFAVDSIQFNTCFGLWISKGIYFFFILFKVDFCCDTFCDWIEIQFI